MLVTSNRGRRLIAWIGCGFRWLGMPPGRISRGSGRSFRAQFIAFAWYLPRVLTEEEDEQRRRDALFLVTYRDPAPAGTSTRQGEPR